MAAPLLDRFGLGNDRAVANARQAALLREREDRILADLIERMSRRQALEARRPGASRAA